MHHQWGALGVSFLALALALTYVGWRLVTPAVCGWLPPSTDAFTPDGQVPRLPPGCAPGSPPSRDRTLVWDRLWHTGATLLFVASLFGLSSYALRRRPRDPAAGTHLVFSSALLGSSLVTVLGLPPDRATGDAASWLFAANVGFVFSLAWGALLAWALSFPSPLLGRSRGSPARALALWAPPLLWLGLSALAGAGRPFVPWMSQAIRIQSAITSLCLAATLALLAHRVLRGARIDPVQRQQLLWIGGSGSIAALMVLAGWVLPSVLMGRSLLPEDLVGLPGLVHVGGMAVAMLRFRLFDLDVVLTRTLVYTTLTALAVLLYVATVGVLTGLVAERAGTAAIAGAVIVAIAVNPLRVWLTRLINRVFYGERDDPYRALTRLAWLLEPHSVAWDEVTASLRRALRIPYAALETGTQVLGEAGTRPLDPTRLHTEPVEHGGRTQGALLVATRGRGQTFSAAEHRLLRDLARTVAARLYEQGLAHEVQASRERLVIAREEERRHLRRALHDEVGPAMAAIALHAEAARLGTEPPDSVGGTLARISIEATRTADAVRRLAYDLRPPALDELGLEAALRDRLGGYAPLTVDLVVADALDGRPPLPAAVESAAYRIVVSALDNVAAHARARTVAVTLERTPDALDLTIDDDGAGLGAAARPGVGVASMRERAAELGGTCAVLDRAAGGVRVHAILPTGGTP